MCRRLVSRRAHGTQSLHLSSLETRVIRRGDDGRLLAAGKLVDSDNDRVTALDAQLELVGGACNLLLEEARLDGMCRAAKLVHPAE